MTQKPTQSASDELAERLASLKQLQDEMNAAIAAADERSRLEKLSRETKEVTENVAPVATQPTPDASDT